MSTPLSLTYPVYCPSGSYPCPAAYVSDEVRTPPIPTNLWTITGIVDNIPDRDSAGNPTRARIMGALPWYWIPSPPENALFIDHVTDVPVNFNRTNTYVAEIQEGTLNKIMVQGSDLELLHVDPLVAHWSLGDGIEAFAGHGSPYATFISNQENPISLVWATNIEFFGQFCTSSNSNGGNGNGNGGNGNGNGNGNCNGNNAVCADNPNNVQVYSLIEDHQIFGAVRDTLLEQDQGLSTTLHTVQMVGDHLEPDESSPIQATYNNQTYQVTLPDGTILTHPVNPNNPPGANVTIAATNAGALFTIHGGDTQDGTNPSLHVEFNSVMVNNQTVRFATATTYITIKRHWLLFTDNLVLTQTSSNTITSSANSGFLQIALGGTSVSVGSQASSRLKTLLEHAGSYIVSASWRIPTLVGGVTLANAFNQATGKGNGCNGNGTLGSSCVACTNPSTTQAGLTCQCPTGGSNLLSSNNLGLTLDVSNYILNITFGGNLGKTIWWFPPHTNKISVAGGGIEEEAGGVAVVNGFKQFTYQYGEMTLYALSNATVTFSVVLPLEWQRTDRNFLPGPPAWPTLDDIPPGQPRQHLAEQVLADLTNANTAGLAGLQVNSNPYIFGVRAARLARLLLIGNLLTDVRSELVHAITVGISCLRKALQMWLTGKNSTLNMYDLLEETTWGGLIVAADITEYDGNHDGNPPTAFGNSFYNQHHYQYGYFIYALAALEHLGQGLYSGLGPLIDRLIRDIANPASPPNEHDSTQMRHKDFWAGHSISTGFDIYLHQSLAVNRQQESVSEAINAYYAVWLFANEINISAGFQNGDVQMYPKVQAGALAALTTELLASESYWRILEPTLHLWVFGNNQIATLASQHMLGRSYALEYAPTPATFPAYNMGVIGIQTLPITEITHNVIVNFAGDRPGQTWLKRIQQADPPYRVTIKTITDVLSGSYTPTKLSPEEPATPVEARGIWTSIVLAVLAASNTVTCDQIQSAWELLTGTSLDQQVNSDTAYPLPPGESYTNLLYWMMLMNRLHGLGFSSLNIILYSNGSIEMNGSPCSGTSCSRRVQNLTKPSVVTGTMLPEIQEGDQACQTSCTGGNCSTSCLTATGPLLHAANGHPVGFDVLNAQGCVGGGCQVSNDTFVRSRTGVLLGQRSGSTLSTNNGSSCRKCPQKSLRAVGAHQHVVGCGTDGCRAPGVSRLTNVPGARFVATSDNKSGRHPRANADVGGPIWTNCSPTVGCPLPAGVGDTNGDGCPNVPLSRWSVTQPQSLTSAHTLTGNMIRSFRGVQSNVAPHGNNLPNTRGCLYNGVATVHCDPVNLFALSRGTSNLGTFQSVYNHPLTTPPLNNCQSYFTQPQVGLSSCPPGACAQAPSCGGTTCPPCPSGVCPPTPGKLTFPPRHRDGIQMLGNTNANLMNGNTLPLALHQSAGPPIQLAQIQVNMNDSQTDIDSIQVNHSGTSFTLTGVSINPYIEGNGTLAEKAASFRVSPESLIAYAVAKMAIMGIYNGGTTHTTAVRLSAHPTVIHTIKTMALYNPFHITLDNGYQCYFTR